jgi:hypothetical protein
MIRQCLAQTEPLLSSDTSAQAPTVIATISNLELAQTAYIHDWPLPVLWRSAASKGTADGFERPETAQFVRKRQKMQSDFHVRSIRYDAAKSSEKK